MIQVGQFKPGNRRRDLERAFTSGKNRADNQRRPDAGANPKKRLQAEAIHAALMDQAEDDGTNEVERSHGKAALSRSARFRTFWVK